MAEDPEGVNLTVKQRIDALTEHSKKIQSQLRLITSQNDHLTEEIKVVSDMFESVKKLESTYVKAQQDALKKKLMQPASERLEEAKAVVKRKHHGKGLEEIDEIINKYPGELKRLEDKIEAMEKSLEHKKRSYESAQSLADDAKAEFDLALSVQTTFEKYAADASALGEKTVQFDHEEDYGGMYLYAREWHAALEGKDPPKPDAAAKAAIDALIEYDKRREAASKRKEEYEGEAGALKDLTDKRDDLKNNRLTHLLDRIHEKLPAKHAAS